METRFCCPRKGKSAGVVADRVTFKSVEHAPHVTPERIAQMIAGAATYGIQIEAGPRPE